MRSIKAWGVLVVTPQGEIKGIGIFSETHPTVMPFPLHTIPIIEGWGVTFEEAHRNVEDQLRQPHFAFGGKLKTHESRGLYRSFGAL